MSFRAFRSAAAVLVALGLLTACTGKTGTTNPPSSDSGTASSAPDNGAPKVPAALPTGALVANPCSALSAAQVTQIGLTGQGTSRQDTEGPSCRWQSSSTDANSVDISAVTKSTGGLGDVYATKTGKSYFEPMTVGGYPAVSTNVTDLRSSGDCPLWVGVTDQLAVVVTSLIDQGPNKTQPCGVSQKVAEAMIQHLKGAA